MRVKQKKLPQSQIELEFELTEEEFKEHINRALERLKKDIKIDGFRPGQAPNKLVEDKIKKESLLMEAGDYAVRNSYLEYIKKNNLEPISRPEVKIIKIAQGSPFVFTITTTLLPEVELPDYKAIARSVKENEVFVTAEEVEASLNYLQKSRAKMILKKDSASLKDFVQIKYQNKDINAGKEIDDQFILGEGGFVKGFEDNLVGMRAGEEKAFLVRFPDDSLYKNLAGKEGEFKVKMVSVYKMELPEVNDEFARQLGAFETLTALKNSIKEGLMVEKQEAERQRKRTEILNKIVEGARLEIPEVMINYEKERLLDDFKNKISQTIKISFEQYLATIKKTEEEIKESYHKEAGKRLKEFLVLREIGKREKIEVSDKEIEDEINKSIKNYSKEQMEKIDINELKEYTKGVITNEKIFILLENLSKESANSTNYC